MRADRHEPVAEQGDSAGRQGRAEDVDAPGPRSRTARHAPRGRHRDRGRDEGHDHERPAPRRPGRGDAAERHAKCRAHAGYSAPRGESPGAGPAVPEQVAYQRHRRRRCKGRAEPLDEPGGDEGRAVRRERTGKGGSGEHSRPGDEHRTPAVPVGQASAEQEQPAERQRVRGGRPDERGGPERQITRDVRGDGRSEGDGGVQHGLDRGEEHEGRGDTGRPCRVGACARARLRPAAERCAGRLLLHRGLRLPRRTPVPRGPFGARKTVLASSYELNSTVQIS